MESCDLPPPYPCFSWQGTVAGHSNNQLFLFKMLTAHRRLWRWGIVGHWLSGGTDAREWTQALKWVVQKGEVAAVWRAEIPCL